MATQQTNATRRRGNSVDFHRQNMQQIREAQQINRERLRQNDYQENKTAAVRQALKEKMGVQNVRSVVDTRAPVALQDRRLPPTGANVDNATIEVFVHECDPDRRNYFSYDEGECVKGLVGGGGDPYGNMPPMPSTAGGKKQPLRPLPNAPPKPKTAPTTDNAGGGASSGLNNVLPHKAGHVPDYLTKRKNELQAIKDEIVRVAREEAEKAKYPPGKRPLTDEEQAQILEALNVKKADLEARLSKIPMRFDNPSVQKRRKETEDEISQVEADMRKYSRKGVLVSTHEY
eukprot:PhF_6_TR38921/c0_g1_i1/m.58219